MEYAQALVNMIEAQRNRAFNDHATAEANLAVANARIAALEQEVVELRTKLETPVATQE
jgi:uncharacterized protein YceH (UPF0502 family)